MFSSCFNPLTLMFVAGTGYSSAYMKETDYIHQWLHAYTRWKYVEILLEESVHKDGGVDSSVRGRRSRFGTEMRRVYCVRFRTSSGVRTGSGSSITSWCSPWN